MRIIETNLRYFGQSEDANLMSAARSPGTNWTAAGASWQRSREGREKGSVLIVSVYDYTDVWYPNTYHNKFSFDTAIC